MRQGRDVRLVFETEVLRAKIADDPDELGCVGCGAIAGCCASYPNCLGNPQWSPPPQAE